MFAVLAALACAAPQQTISVAAPASDSQVIGDFVARLGDERVSVVPADELKKARGLTVELSLGQRCAECYAVSGEDGTYRIDAGGRLGLQYGLAHLLETAGYRFPSPWRTRLPDSIPDSLPAEDPLFEGEHAPEQALRGLHMHTLHPIEPLWGFWAAPPDGSDGQARAEAVIDWVVKNRGNHLQWVALDDIESGGAPHEAWLSRTTAVVAAAHERGLSTGLGIQLFGSGNLQQAFDLIDDPADSAQWQASIDQRLGLLTPAGFDVYDLSFGEFFGEEPERFIDAVDLAFDRLRAADPDADMSAVVHVGDSPDQRVEYQGQDLIYYMLAQFADPEIILHVHTVMYYTLYDDAGGAYHHDDFSEHRQLLLDQLAAGERVAYFPESAYWVAFDSPVPQYLPLYVRSRHRDMAGLRADATAGGFADLDEHVLFSTGWEWGYWQNDAFTLRMGWQLPADWGDLYRDWWAVDGDEGATLAQAVIDLAEAQHLAHIEQRAAAYLAGRDIAMDVGFATGVVAAPDRVGVHEVGELSAQEQQELAETLLPALETLATATDAALYRVVGLTMVDQDGDPWAEEVRDGIEIDLWRTRFVLALYRAALAATGAIEGDPDALLEQADGYLAAARLVVERRHDALHDPLGSVLVSDAVDNPTIYQYGYLVRSDQLCFWERERLQAAEALQGSTEPVPGCF